MQEFREKILHHVEHVKSVGLHCATEETTKQALILPLLDILGFSPFDPLMVVAEYASDVPGVKFSERVDYALFSDSRPVMFIEAKPHTANLTNHAPQLARYFNATPGVKIAVITNGREWRFFTDLKHSNVLDETPFLAVDFTDLADGQCEQLQRFHHDQFQPDALRTFAEDRMYLALFRDTIEAALREVDADFVRFVAMRADLAPKLTTKFLESVAPLVKQAVAESLSRMVVTGLNRPQPAIASAGNGSETPAPAEEEHDPANPKIVTTATEKKILQIVHDILGGVAGDGEIVAKDTESYYAILFQGKTNRWLLRYAGNRAKPLIFFQFDMTPEHEEYLKHIGMIKGSGNSVVLEKPEHLMRLSIFLLKSLEFCRNDDNFRKGNDNGHA